MKRVFAEDVSAMMNWPIKAVYEALKQEKMPFAISLKSFDGRHNYLINPYQLREWAGAPVFDNYFGPDFFVKEA